MALIIEDGSQVVGANSYATVAQLTDYAAQRGIALPVGDPARELLLVKAADYIELRRDRFLGSKVSRDQPLSWPRTGVTLDDEYVEHNEIPLEVVQAQLVVAAKGQSVDLAPTSLPSDKGPVVAERVGPVAVQYAALGRAGVAGITGLPSFPDAEALLKRLYRAAKLTTYRA